MAVDSKSRAVARSARDDGATPPSLSGPGEPPPGRRRGLLVEQNPVRLALLDRFLLHLSDLLRRQLTGVFLLDLGQPGSALARFRLVDLDSAAVQGLVDLFKQDVAERRLRHLPHRLAAGEAQTLVLAPGITEGGVRRPAA